MLELDIILVMDWLVTQWAKTNCRYLKVTLRDQEGQKVWFCGKGLRKEYSI